MVASAYHNSHPFHHQYLPIYLPPITTSPSHRIPSSPRATSRHSITATIITSVSTYHHHNPSFLPPSHHFHNHHYATPPLTATVLPLRLSACHSAHRRVTQHSTEMVNHAVPVKTRGIKPKSGSPTISLALTYKSVLLRTLLWHVRQFPRIVPISIYRIFTEGKNYKKLGPGIKTNNCQSKKSFQLLIFFCLNVGSLFLV